MRLKVKICGLKTEEAIAAAVSGGAAMVGFIFYPPSPRYITPSQAGALIKAAANGANPVGVFVDPSDETLNATLASAPLSFVQLHGSETPERVAEVRRRFGLPVIRALPLSGTEDLDRAESYVDVVDWLMFDAKPPAGRSSALPGGNGLAFDWQLLSGRRFIRPWLLSGGLDATNLAEAVHASGAAAVDVSSGVERARGEKDISKIEAFLQAARGL
jgi:phosphoribosylanthranilate isomerase